MGKNDLHLEEAASSLTMSQEHKVLYHTEVLPATRPQITFLLPGKGTPPSVTAAVRSASTDTPQCPHHSSGTLWHEDLGQTSRSKEKKKTNNTCSSCFVSRICACTRNIFILMKGKDAFISGCVQAL